MGREEDYHHHNRHHNYDHRRSNHGRDRSRRSHHHQHHRSSSGHRHSPRTSDIMSHHQPSPFQSMNPFPVGLPLVANPDLQRLYDNPYQQMAMMQQQQQQYIPQFDINHIPLDQNLMSVPSNSHVQNWNVPDKQVFDNTGPMVQSLAPRSQVISNDRDILNRLQLPPEKITETGIIPDKAYYELPAGLMVPLIPAGQKQYKPINPRDLRLPFPKFPDDNFLKTIDSYYKPDCKTRDNDGWDREFIKKITS